MKKWMYILSIVCFVSCKVETTIQPKTMLSEETVQSESSESVNLQANAIANAMVVLLQNDTIRNALYIECGKGVEEYFWISFEEFQKRLLEKWNINFDSKLNAIIARQNGFESKVNYLKLFLDNARTNGFSPHISIPNLQKITNIELTEDRILNLSFSDVTPLSSYTVSTYMNYEEEGQSTGFNGLTIKDNYIVSKFIPNDLLCDELLVIVAYRIVNPNVVSPCAKGSDIKFVYNCVFNSPVCKICNVQNKTIVDEPTGPFGAIEHRIVLDNYPVVSNSIDECYHDAFVNPSLNTNNNYVSFGYLSSLNQLYYYEPIDGDIKNINNSSFKNMKLNIIKNPLNFINYNFPTPTLEKANKVTLCLTKNEFVTHNTLPGMNEINGGIYSISRLNGKPIYFYFPGHILGSLIYNSGPDNEVNYSLGMTNQFCANSSLEQSLESKLMNSSGCMYCNSNFNSLNLSKEYFVNTDKNFLIDYWYSSKLVVAVSFEAYNFKTPEQNVVTFDSDISYTNQCNLSFQNKTLLVELLKNGNEIDQIKYFDAFYPSGTTFYIEAYAKFQNGKCINNCKVINSIGTNANSIKLASIIPLGNITEMSVKVYKVN